MSPLPNLWSLRSIFIYVFTLANINYMCSYFLLQTIDLRFFLFSMIFFFRNLTKNIANIR